MNGREPTEPAWISHVDAAELIGCHPDTIRNMARDGRLRTRTGPRGLPSIDRASALEVAQTRRREGELAEARKQARPQPDPNRGHVPDTGDVWVSVDTAAAMLGVSRGAIHHRIRAEHLPSVLHGGRRWLRQVDVAVAVNVRAFKMGGRASGGTVRHH